MVVTARERRRAHLRSDVVEGTLAIIARDGVESVTIDAITAEVGIARATVYAHFPDGRESILRSAYERAGSELVERARDRAAAAGSWQERILAYAAEMIEFSSSATLGHFYSVTGPALVGFREQGGAGSRGYREDIGVQLDLAREAGELRADADPEALAVLLSSSLRDAGIAAAHDPALAGRFAAAVGMLLVGLSADRPSRGEAA